MHDTLNSWHAFTVNILVQNKAHNVITQIARSKEPIGYRAGVGGAPLSTGSNNRKKEKKLRLMVASCRYSKNTCACCVIELWRAGATISTNAERLGAFVDAHKAVVKGKKRMFCR